MGLGITGCSDCEVEFGGHFDAYQKVMWLIIAINAAMFAVEATASLIAPLILEWIDP